jgi:ABC-type glycerol-3-phosphate transport system substrate-binding protein
MKKRKFGIALTTVLLAATLFGAPVMAQEEPVEIDVWTVVWSAPSIEMMAQLVEMFNEEYAGQIHANYVQGDWGEGDTYVAAGVAGGGGIACVVEWYTGGVQEWYSQGFVIDMAPYMEEEDWATIPDHFWASRMTEDGEVFISGTVGPGPSLIYYNPALLEAAGLEAPTLEEGPWTWEEFLEAARALTVDANGNNLPNSTRAALCSGAFCHATIRRRCGNGRLCLPCRPAPSRSSASLKMARGMRSLTRKP